MAKIFKIFIPLALLLLFSCQKQDRVFSVIIENPQVKVGATKTYVLEYCATGYEGTVSAELDRTVTNVTILNDFDKNTGKGTVTFSTDDRNGGRYDSYLIFKDANKETRTSITINISSTWTIIPT